MLEPLGDLAKALVQFPVQFVLELVVVFLVEVFPFPYEMVAVTLDDEVVHIAPDESLERLGSEIGIQVPEADNQAKQLARRLEGKLPVIYGAAHLSQVGRR